MSSSNTKMRTQCPVGYEPVEINDSVDCPVIEDVLSENNSSSLWLIKVPHDFDVSSLSGQNVVLNGSQDLLYISGKNKDKRYEIQSKQQTSSELSSFSVVLPSLREKSFRAASSLHGQMSVIQAVSVPPSTLPETSQSLTVQKQTHSEYIKKWKPFGYRKPQRNLKGKTKKEPAEHLEEGSPGRIKEYKDKEKANFERTATVEKKDKGRQEFGSSQMKAETGLERTRKRKGDEKSKSREGENEIKPAKQKKEKSGRNLAGNVVVKQESDENDKRVNDVNREVDSGHDFTRVERGSGETPKKAKKDKKNKTGKHEKKEIERTSHSFSYDGFI